MAVPPDPRPRRTASSAATAAIAAALVAAVLAGCGGGGAGGTVDPQPTPSPLGELPSRRASAPGSPVATSCTGGGSGIVYRGAEVEPFVAASPATPGLLLAAWQQDRSDSGGALALVTAVSGDGGASWQTALQPMSRCGGGATGSTGDFARASDPWVDVSPDGTMHLMGLAFSGTMFTTSSDNAMLASRSTDGGRSWSAPQVLQRDGGAFFNDKGSLTADPTDSKRVYAVWDRLDPDGRGPTMFARSTDGGASWQSAVAIHAPVPAAGTGVAQTLGNRIVVLAGGAERGLLVNVFTQIETSGANVVARIGAMRSADGGTTWSAPVFVGDLRSIGTRDPATGRAVRDGAILPTAAGGPDGVLWVAWQDSRFSGGVRDAIALSRSADGGRSWSAPVAVNRVAAAQAFTPALHLRGDGAVGLLHYDLRSDTSDPAMLLADAWLLTSTDGVQWAESHVAGPFDLSAAPDSRGFFLGDYQGLTSLGTAAFVPVVVLSRADAANRSDVYSPRIEIAPRAPSPMFAARPAPAAGESAAAAAARQQALRSAIERRLPGSTSRQRAAAVRRAADPAPSEYPPPR